MKPRQLKRSQQGFALIAAIVLIVVLAAMAGFVATMVSGQSTGQQLERMSGVAERAAQTGVEWGAYQVLKASVPCPPVPAPLPLSPLTSANLPGIPAGMTVDVECSKPAADYVIEATATFGGVETNPDYVERIKTASFP